jgi:DNA-binding NtrC family response regulator
MNKARILLVDNDRLTQKSLYEMLCRNGYKVEIANSTEESLRYLETGLYRIILSGIDGTEAVDLLKIVKERTYPTEVIILTSYGNIEIAVKSIKMGAFDYFVRPVEDEKIISAIERALANNITPQSKSIITKKVPCQKEDLFYGLVGKSSNIHEIYSLIERISRAKTTVLLRGESGTGKRMVARAIHEADTKRAHKPFVEISCGVLSQGIIESELFGHTKGSFTDAISDRRGRFELAHGGTLLLDDIDVLSLDIQVKLLRVLQHKEFERLGDHKTIKVDVRIIVATNHDLEKAVAENRFREDLYYRLNVISIDIPPLREHKEDIPLLVEHFIELFAKENLKNIKGITKDALEALINYSWPGNIRQLENIIERAAILNTDFVITKDDLPEIILNGNILLRSELNSQEIQDFTSLKDALKEPEKVYILKVLKEMDWNKKRAARKLGVNRTTLYNKLKKYNIFSS